MQDSVFGRCSSAPAGRTAGFDRATASTPFPPVGASPRGRAAPGRRGSLAPFVRPAGLHAGDVLVYLSPMTPRFESGRPAPDPERLARGIRAGDRATLARAITLIESRRGKRGDAHAGGKGCSPGHSQRRAVGPAGALEHLPKSSAVVSTTCGWIVQIHLKCNRSRQHDRVNSPPNGRDLVQMNPHAMRVIPDVRNRRGSEGTAH